MSTPLDRLAQINPTAAFVGALTVVLVGLFAPGVVGGGALLLMALALAYVSRLTWSVQPPATRAARLAVLTVLVLIALVKIL